MDFVRLGLKNTRGDPIAEELLEAIHGIFSDASMMVARRLFPLLTSLLLDLGKGLGARVSLFPRDRVFPRGTLKNWL